MENKSKIVGPSIAELVICIIIWIVFSIQFYQASRTFFLVFLLLFVPVMLIAFFHEYEIKDQKLFYRPFLKVVMRARPSELDLTKPFKLESDFGTSSVVSSNLLVALSAFIPFRSTFILDDAGNRFAPLNTKGYAFVWPQLERYAKKAEREQVSGSD